MIKAKSYWRMSCGIINFRIGICEDKVERLSIQTSFLLNLGLIKGPIVCISSCVQIEGCT